MLLNSDPVEIAFTDGSVDVNSKAAFSKGAGAAVIIQVDNRGADPLVKGIRLLAEYHEGYDDVTNNTMELTGIKLAINSTSKEAVLHLWSDSQYALGVLFNSSWKPGQNRRLIDEIKREARTRAIEPRFIKGHQNLFMNELADLVAGRAVTKQKNIDHNLDIKDGTQLVCLSCRRFPCNISRERWRDVFGALRTRTWRLCTRVDQYADFPGTAVFGGPNDSNRSIPEPQEEP